MSNEDQGQGVAAQGAATTTAALPPYRGGAWRDLPQSVEFYGFGDEIVLRVDGHLPLDAHTGKRWRGDVIALHSRGRSTLLKDVDPAIRAVADAVLARPAPNGPLRVYRLCDGGFAFRMSLTAMWTLDDARTIVRGEREETAELIDPVELPQRERALLAPWEALLDRLFDLGPPFAAYDERALVDAPVDRDALRDLNGRPLPGRPLAGMRMQVRWGGHAALFTAFDVLRADARQFVVEGPRAPATFAAADWPRWLARRLLEGVVTLCLPGCDYEWCRGCDGSVVGVVEDAGEAARIAAARTVRAVRPVG